MLPVRCGWNNIQRQQVGVTTFQREKRSLLVLLWVIPSWKCHQTLKIMFTVCAHGRREKRKIKSSSRVSWHEKWAHVSVFPYVKKEYVRAGSGVFEECGSERRGRAHHVPLWAWCLRVSLMGLGWEIGWRRWWTLWSCWLSAPANPIFRQAMLSSGGCAASPYWFPLTSSCWRIVWELCHVLYRTVTSPKGVTSRESSIQIAPATWRDTDVIRSCRRALGSLLERTALHFGTLGFALLLKFPRIKRKGICEETRLIIDSKCIFIAFLNYHN